MSNHVNIEIAPSAILIGIDDQSKSMWSSSDSIAECIELAKTANIFVRRTLIQRRERPATRTYLGTGKLEELANELESTPYDIIITDDELLPNQHKFLEKTFNKKVIDRSALILDIFASRAHTYEAQLQVELAQLEYLLPRLTGLWTHLSRQSGGIGTRGPGEKQLEVDKRQIRHRIGLLRKDIEKVRQHRSVTREKRQTTPVPVVALIGYTNAGKSTLMRTLSAADVLVEDKLFATLDPTTRQIVLPSNEQILLTDTVGFIQKLPHQLVSAFKSTLEELQFADLLIHVVDASDPKIKEKVATTEELLRELNVINKQRILVLNKIDLVPDSHRSLIINKFSEYPVVVPISAQTHLNIDTLLTRIQDAFQKNHIIQDFHIPYNRMDIVSLIHQKGKVVAEIYGENFASITVDINRIIADKIMGLLSK